MRDFRRHFLLAILSVFLLSSCGQSLAEQVVDQGANLPPVDQPPPNLSLEDGLMASPLPTTVSTIDLKPSATRTPSPQPSETPTATPLPSLTPTITPTPCSSPGQIVQGTYPSEAAGTSAYRVYLPPCYDPDGPGYPTLYLLPGNIYRDEVWDRLGMDETAEELIQQGQIAPFIIVMADSGTLLNFTSGGEWSYETQIVEDLIPFIDSEYCTWAESRGRAIGGMSRGGYWALEIAFRHPDLFASVGGHSASLYDLYGGPDVIPQATGLANDLGDLRIYFDVGESDWVIGNIRQLHQDMEEAGIQHVWMLNEGWHDETYWSSHIEEYIDWYAEPWPVMRDAYPACLKKEENNSS